MELVIGRRYRYTEWDKNNNQVECEYMGSKNSIDGPLYEFKYVGEMNGSFVTLYPEKIEEVMDLYISK